MYNFYGLPYPCIAPESQNAVTEVNQIETLENVPIETRIRSQESKECIAH